MPECASSHPPAFSWSAFFFALYVASAGDTSGFFNGTIDEVAIYNTALCAQTVQDHYELGTNPFR